jgi:AraC-like DNA-binding protein
MIRASTVGRLLEASAKVGSAEDFGLRMAETRRLSIFGPIGLLLQQEPTVRRALASLARYLRLHTDALALGIEEEGETAIIREERNHPGAKTRTAGERAHDGRAAPYPALAAGRRLEAGTCMLLARGASDGGRPRPLLRLSSRLRCDVNGFVCAAKALDARLPKGDPVMARYAQQYLDSILEPPHATTADKVRQFVRALLPSGRCSIEQVAQHRGMDRRTIHRHLASDAETLSSIVDAVPAELVTRYLTTTDRPLAEVADLLGFSGLSALSRWFSGRFDCSASAWRAAHRGRMIPAR